MAHKQGKVESTSASTIPVSVSVVGDMTIAAIIVGNDMFYGTAAPNHEDRFDRAIGHDLAVGRALEALANDMISRAEGKVKHNDDMREHAAKCAEERARRERASEAGRKAAATRKKNREMSNQAIEESDTLKSGKKVEVQNRGKKPYVMSPAQEQALIKARQVLAANRAAQKKAQA